MRLIIILFLFLSSCALKAQLNERTAIHFNIRDCRDLGASGWFVNDSVQLYKMPEDSLAYTIAIRGQKSWPVIIENAAIGEYKMVYRNMYKQTVTEQITLTNGSHNNILACADKLLNYPQNTLATLVQNDSLVIRYTSIGCFSWDNKKLVITKEKDQFVAKLYNATSYQEKIKKKYVRKYWDGDLLSTVTLTENNLKDFIRFENELNAIKNDGCTTTDIYEIISKRGTIERVDGSCNWRGFNYLLKSFLMNQTNENRPAHN